MLGGWRTLSFRSLGLPTPGVPHRWELEDREKAWLGHPPRDSFSVNLPTPARRAPGERYLFAKIGPHHNSVWFQRLVFRHPGKNISFFCSMRVQRTPKLRYIIFSGFPACRVVFIQVRLLYINHVTAITRGACTTQVRPGFIHGANLRPQLQCSGSHGTGIDGTHRHCFRGHA